jgi:hypothetical protein
MQLDMTYRAPEAIESFVKELYATPAELVREIQEIAPSP